MILHDSNVLTLNIRLILKVLLDKLRSVHKIFKQGGVFFNRAECQ